MLLLNAEILADFIGREAAEASLLCGASSSPSRAQIAARPTQQHLIAAAVVVCIKYF